MTNIGEQINKDSEQEKKLPEGQEDVGDNNLREIRAHNERRIERVKQFDFNDPDLGYSAGEKEKIERLQERFKDIVTLSGDDSKKFLELIKEQDVGVVENSRFLKGRTQSIEGVIFRPMGTPKGINASYLTPESIERLLKEEKKDSSVYAELNDGQKKNGLILLYKKPNAKSVFHEGFHALQYLDGFNMKPGDQEEHAKRELEASWAIIKTKEEGLLSEVDRLKEKKVFDIGLGKVPTYGPNDIEKEAIQFFSNFSKIRAGVAERRDEEVLEAARKEIETIN